jgi:hypothetical protein
MKKVGLIIILVLTLGFIAKAQTTRYFEFITDCGHGNWQDTSFIASTSNQILIDSVLANIARPINQRKIISGQIDYGNGGHNRNATHWFLWHFIPTQWDLVDAAVEICDGCPYTDIDSNPYYWIETSIGYYCPWSSKPVREVSNPLGIDESIFENDFLLYPNPSKDKLILDWSSKNDISATIHNSNGQEVMGVFLSSQNNTINISSIEKGLYFLKIRDNNKIAIKKFIIE